MTFLIKSERINGHYIAIEQDKTGVIKVIDCPMFGDDLVGYPYKSCSYAYDELTKAKATYNRYRRAVQ